MKTAFNTQKKLNENKEKTWCIYFETTNLAFFKVVEKACRDCIDATERINEENSNENHSR